ncbi:hypothetical protein L861_03475 [Litchfieldella anticariensis FP35 = DSM 16096]|uniref:Translocation and assembly module subunit TamA n=1 Tax=Litchfieldella anticariensis (strain DSM 16096 / CECT 5854 / CIP 108499 / LMG 22089 / FP35) TaxID=1121939 RepID=S2KRA2_LITA3|nr:autotransporter assembly complex family protein [Halomonas anticariensis]EPC04395.1 hypothetical protein L861_03475 [Halomonas anticariensis FP35 = DSM 16096]
MGHRILAPLGVAALSSCLTLPTLALEARVEGLTGAPEDNVSNYLEGLDATQYSRSRLEGEVRRRTGEALRVYGYYEPDIVLEFVGEKPDSVNVTIDPGPRVKISALDIQVRGEAENDSAFRDVLDAFPLAEGDPLRHAPYDRLRNQLSSLSLERGYFDSIFLERRMEVRPWKQSARLYLILDSGDRYRFGEIDYHGSQIDEARLRQMLPFSPGEPYLAAQLAEYNQRLSQSEWFSSIAIRPRLREEETLALSSSPSHWWEQVERQGSVPSPSVQPTGPVIDATALNSALSLRGRRSLDVPLDVNLVPADRHQFETGIGYATDVGPRLRFSWHRPWLNSAGHSLNHDLFLAAPDQRLTGEYIMPLEDPLRDSYRLQYGFRQRDNEDTQSMEASVELARRWQFDNDWVQSLYLRSTFEDFTQADESAQVFLLYPGISWSRIRTRNPRFPTWGDRQRLAFEYSNRAWGSDANFFRTTLDSQWIRMLGSNTRFVGRIGLGAISTEDFDKIPPSLRFFAGGDRSVRGYSYESLAPRDEEGDLLGGQQLFTTSLEVQRRVTGDWWGAAFVDVGDAFNDWWPSELNTGAGLGVRWISPVGPIRFDIAHPFDDEEKSWRIHFAIGPEF